MADKKVATKVPIPLPSGKINRKKVQRVMAIPPHPEPKPKPKRKQLPKKEPEYAELNRQEPENNYQPLCSATRERHKEKLTTKLQQKQNQEVDPLAPELNYDDVCSQSRRLSSDDYENNPLKTVETNKPATKQTVKEGQKDIKRSNADLQLKYDSQSRKYENLPLNAVDTNKPATKSTVEQKQKEIKRSNTDLQLRYDDVHVQVPQEQDLKNCENYELKVVDRVDDGVLTEKDFNTNCCYAYRKVILMVGVIITAMIIVVLFLAMITGALSQASENAQGYQELQHMTQTMAEHIVSLEQQLNYSLTSSETTSEALKQQITELEERLASSVNNLTSTISNLESLLSNSSKQTSSELQELKTNVTILRNDIDSLSNSTVSRTEFEQELSNIQEEFREQQEATSQQFMSNITTLNSKTEQLNSSIVQLTAHTIPIYCAVTINETIAVNEVVAHSTSYQLDSQNVSIIIANI